MSLATPDSTTLLAVYGTLRRGFRNHHLVLGRADWVGPARLSGRMLHIGGPRRPYSYPGYLPAPSGAVVAELLHVTDPTLWPELHDLETYHPDDPAASEYLLAPAFATRPDGRSLPCVTYVYNAHDGSWPLVPDGDWASVVPPTG